MSDLEQTPSLSPCAPGSTQAPLYFGFPLVMELLHVTAVPGRVPARSPARRSVLKTLEQIKRVTHHVMGLA